MHRVNIDKIDTLCNYSEHIFMVGAWWSMPVANVRGRSCLQLSCSLALQVGRHLLESVTFHMRCCRDVAELGGGVNNDYGRSSPTIQECTMHTCFDLTLCKGRPFKVHIYPLLNGKLLHSSR